MSNQTLSASKGANSKLPSTEFLTFKLGHEEYGVDIQKVQELRGYDSVTRIANAKDYTKGIINLRGVIVPIFDLRIKLDTSPPTYNQFTVVIVLDIGGRVVGAVVDSVSEVVNFDPNQIKAAPQLGNTLESNYIIGIGTIDDRMVTLIDIALLLADAELNLISRLVA